MESYGGKTMGYSVWQKRCVGVYRRRLGVSTWGTQARRVNKTSQRVYTFMRRLQQDKRLQRLGMLKYAYILWAWKTGDPEFLLGHWSAYVYMKAGLVGYVKQQPYAWILRSYLSPVHVRRLIRLRKHIKIAAPLKNAMAAPGYKALGLACIPVWLSCMRHLQTPLRSHAEYLAARRAEKKEKGAKQYLPVRVKNWKRVVETCFETLLEVVKK